VLGLSACQTTQQLIGQEPDPETAPSVEPEPTNAEDAGQVQDTDAIAPARPANPYLANPKPVPARVQQLFTAAMKLHEAQNWAEAELAWQEVTLTAPELSGPFINLGIVYEATDRIADAEQAYRSAIDANKLNLNAYNQLAILKRKQGEFEQAEVLYLQALDIWPEHPASHKNLAILYDLYMGRLVDALGHYEQYQASTDNPERALAGWLADLRRRIDALAREN
jgi:tetratricopeptide (TPR) repeat protein